MPVVAGLAIVLGASVPLLLQQGCGLLQDHPRTAVEAFQAVCVAALEVESENRHRALTDQAIRYCSDPELPDRIVSLLEMAQHVDDEPDLLPLPLDGGL